MGRNILRADGFENFDFSVFKRWPFQESRHVELRGEFFNLLNHTNFGYPGALWELHDLDKSRVPGILAAKFRLDSRSVFEHRSLGSAFWLDECALRIHYSVFGEPLSEPG